MTPDNVVPIASAQSSTIAIPCRSASACSAGMSQA